MLPDIVRYSIPIFISDDSTDLETCKLIDSLKLQYEHIYYVKNEPSLGHDKNILNALQFPTTEYVWLLGDSVIVRENAMADIIDIIESDYDFIFVNAYVDSSPPTSVLKDISFFVKYTWYLSLTGATIYNSRVIKKFFSEHELKFYKNFQQVAVMLSYLNVRVNAYWVGEKIITINASKKSYWTSNVIEVLVADWCNLIKSFPSIFDTDILVAEVVRSHDENIDLFGCANMLRYRSTGGIKLCSVLKNMDAIRMATKRSILYFTFFALIPRPIVLCLRSVVKFGRTFSK